LDLDIEREQITAAKIPRPEFFWRVMWIAFRLILVFALAGETQPFFYQAF
jgi:hypothetical protein